MQLARSLSGSKNIGISALAALYLLHWPGAYNSEPVRWTTLAFILLNLTLWFVDAVVKPGRLIFQTPDIAIPAADANTLRADALPVGIMLFLFACGYVILRGFEVNYFNQDDNFSQFGPVIIQGVTSFLEKGIFPSWNPYQFMGQPVADVGTYALTYPGTYFSVAIAKYFLKNPEGWADIFFLVHAIPGLVLTFRVMRLSRVSPVLAVAASLAFIFCGYNVMAGRSWFYMTPAMVTLPILAWLLLRLENFATPKWLWTAALTMGISFHAGNTQMWFYWILFLGIGILYSLFTTRTLPIKAVILRSSSAFFIGLGMAVPLLLPQMTFIAGVKRIPTGLGNIADNLASLLFPYPLVVATYPNNMASDDLKFGQLYYASTVFTVAAIVLFATLYVQWLRQPEKKVDQLTGVYVLLGVLAFFFSLGDFGILWRVLSTIPPFSLFAHPFKFLVYMHFFWILAAARFLSSLNWRYAWSLSALSIFLTGYHLTQSYEAFYLFSERHYSPLPDDLAAPLKKNAAGAEYFRIDSNAPPRYKGNGYLYSLPHNFPTAYGIAATWGYDPLVNATAENRPLQLKWTVARCGDPSDQHAHFVALHIYNCPENKYYSPEPLENFLRLTGVTSRLTFPLNGGKGRPFVRAVAQADPIVFALENKATTFPFHVDFSGITVENPTSMRGPVLVNFLWRKPFKAFVDNRPVGIEKDEWGRMIVRPEASWKTLTFSYRPEWFQAFGIGVFLFSAGLFMMRRSQRFAP